MGGTNGFPGEQMEDMTVCDDVYATGSSLNFLLHGHKMTLKRGFLAATLPEVSTFSGKGRLLSASVESQLSLLKNNLKCLILKFWGPKYISTLA